MESTNIVKKETPLISGTHTNFDDIISYNFIHSMHKNI